MELKRVKLSYLTGLRKRLLTGRGLGGGGEQRPQLQKFHPPKANEVFARVRERWHGSDSNYLHG